MVIKYDFVSMGITYILVFWLYPSIIVILKSKPISKICNTKVIGVLGKIAFDTYIWHEPLTAFRNLLMVRFSWNIDIMKLSSMLLFALAAWIVGTISYFSIERPIEKYLKAREKTKLLEDSI